MFVQASTFGGGGGGFSGGGTGGNGYYGGGGGGSYNTGTDQDNQNGINVGHGKVIITSLSSSNLNGLPSIPFSSLKATPQ